MSEEMPLRGIRWVEDYSIDEILQEKDESVGHIIEVDLNYPNNQLDEHNDYPLAPESLSVFESFLEPYQQNILSILKKRLQISKISKINSKFSTK